MVSEEKIFENVDGRTDGRTDDGVIGILIAHLGAFGSGELKIQATSIGSDQTAHMHRLI